jgi:MerR family mercuric resistance operon transcriptional regulator
MNNQKRLTIGAVAKELGICTETIRYYHRIGLLPVPMSFPNCSVRVYAEDQLQLLRFIKRAQRLGFSLDEIRALLELSKGNHCDAIQFIVARKVRELEKKMAEIARMRDSLAALLKGCTQNNGNERCPVIYTLFEEAYPIDKYRNSGARLH